MVHASRAPSPSRTCPTRKNQVESSPTGCWTSCASIDRRVEWIPPSSRTRNERAASVMLWAVAMLLVVVGFVGIIVPALPGHILIFAGLLLAAWQDGFSRVGMFTIILLGIL